MPKPITTLLIAIAAAAIYSLVSGAAYLEVMLPGGLPFGNALTAIGLCSAAGAAIGLSTPRSLHRSVAAASFVAAILWLPVSIALAGNLALNFSGDNGLAWIVLSASTAIAVLGSLAWVLVRWIHTRLFRSGT